MRRLTVARGPALDRLFLTMMREHHLGGVAMADYAAKWAKLDKVAGLAVTIAKNQRFEIADYERLIATMLIVPMASMINEAPPKP